MSDRTKIKTCSRCKTDKPLNGFYNNAGKPDNVDNYCKDCRKETTYKNRYKKDYVLGKLWDKLRKRYDEIGFSYLEFVESIESEFDKTHKIWEESGYSIHRRIVINLKDKDMTLDNITLTTLDKSNPINEIGLRHRRVGVVTYKDGVITKYVSESDASRSLGVRLDRLRYACRKSKYHVLDDFFIASENDITGDVEKHMKDLEAKLKKKEETLPTGTRRCKECKTTKSICLFSKSKESRGGRTIKCKQCMYKLVVKNRRTKLGLLKTLYSDQVTQLRKGRIIFTFSKDEFIEWALSQTNFEELYDEWVQSGYSTNSRPRLFKPIEGDIKSYVLVNGSYKLKKEKGVFIKTK